GQPIPRTVWVLGWVSLCMDTSSELVHSLLPIFITVTLGASATALGLIEGVAESLALVVKVFSGRLSDRLGRRVPLILAGYGLATLVKPLFPLAQSLTAVATARWLDRVGKGIRGAPRDALVADVTPMALRGAAFGLRQSMDTIGAVLGPLLAIALMWALDGRIRVVLWLAIAPAMLAVWLIVRHVREAPAPTQPTPRSSGIVTKVLRLPAIRSLPAPYWRLVAVAMVLTLPRISEAFLILRATQLGAAAALAPLVLVCLSLTYTLTAYPAGWLSDRVPRMRMVALGMAVLVIANAMLATAQGLVQVLFGVGMWGVHLGLTQGVLASRVADTVPASQRGTGFGVFNLAVGVAVLLASVGAGVVWDRLGPPTLFVLAGGIAACGALLVLTLRGDDSHTAMP
ncbi:MAG: MFS transporter, partial [Xanthomonadaceae bacterium]|nr:MFS transporter [Xanthomonadaceae bacterium]